MADAKLEVLVVGAGPVGLTLAGELARHGARPRVIDQAKGPSDFTRATTVHSRTLEVFEDLGVSEEAIAAGLKLFGTNVYAEGKRLAHLSFDELETPFPFQLSLPQNLTEKILAGHAQRNGVSIEWGVKLASLTQDDAAVVATLLHPDGREEKVEVPYLVGCDGGNSTVRKHLDVSFDGSTVEEAALFADARLDFPLPDDEAHVFFAAEGAMSVSAMKDGFHRIVAQLAAPMPEGQQPNAGHVQQLLDARGPKGAKVLETRWAGTTRRVEKRQVKAYRKERVFLAGEAAHLHSPASGQGMNTGIQDAYNLGWKLALVLRGHSKEALLESYHAERHPVAQATVFGSDLTTRVVSLRSAVGTEVRNRLVSALTTMEVVQKRVRNELSDLKLNYRHSPIVGEHRSAVPGKIFRGAASEDPSMRDWLDFGVGPAPGDRAPDGPITVEGQGAPTRLFELMKHIRHTLLLFDGFADTAQGYANLAAIAKGVGERYGQLVKVHVVVPRATRPTALPREVPLLLDPGKELHHRYGAGAECLYLMRPDGCVGFRSQPAEWESLLLFLERLFVR